MKNRLMSSHSVRPGVPYAEVVGQCWLQVGRSSVWHTLFLAGFVSACGIASWRGNLEDFKAQRIGLVPAVIALLVAATVLLPGLQAAEFDFFEKQIRPLFHKHCFECHSTKGGKAKGGLVLDRREGWVTVARFGAGDRAGRSRGEPTYPGSELLRWRPKDATQVSPLGGRAGGIGKVG